ncbi:hypothetical protein [Paenibacillus timonensis]|uniref:hypothetical protein n=1 Tax=Paenibacillus timonensis TaxID=225915 RepID=UPI001F05294D|nr:hypothetical protein [Paenibacillus timonensis]
MSIIIPEFASASKSSSAKTAYESVFTLSNSFSTLSKPCLAAVPKASTVVLSNKRICQL